MSIELDAAMTAYACSPTAANRQAVEAMGRIAHLEADLSAARFAAKLHLQTVLTQQAIIKAQAECLAQLEKGK